MRTEYCVKNVSLWNSIGPHFPAFGLNTDIYRANLPIQYKCGKMQTRKTLNTDAFHAVESIENWIKSM